MTESLAAGDRMLAAADQVELVATTHLDQVHDLVRRLGCPEPEATEIVGRTLLGLVDEVADGPRPAPDAIGAWFAASRALAARSSCDEPGEPAGDGADGVTVEEALGHLPPPARTAVLLRDHYDLPVEVAAATLEVGADEAARAVADGRLRLFREVCGRDPADLVGHRPHPVADAGLLGRYADGTVPPAREIAVARHVAGCPDCGDVVSAQDRARRLVGALPVIEMGGEERAAVLARARGRAAAALPRSLDLVTFTAEEPPDATDAAPVRAMLVLSLLALAAVAGLVAGILTALAAR
ncbi:MAG: zf-HC2 domain-containing protein [Frankiaceae bacterium]